MSLRTRLRILLFTGVALGIGLLRHTATAQDAAQTNGPDPREIPVPPIKTPIGHLPGVDELPLRKEMPDVLVTNGGSQVTTRSQWQSRREDSKTGAAIRMQAPVAAANLIALMEGRAPPQRYDGYTACPIVTKYGKVLMAEFGYGKKPAPSFPLLDPGREHSAGWHLKVHLLRPL